MLTSKVLAQSLASIMFLAIPGLLFLPLLLFQDARQSPSSTLTVIALIAYCVEIEVFLWVVLIPLASKASIRLNHLNDDVMKGHTQASECLRVGNLKVVLCMAVLVPLVGWANGYRWPAMKYLGAFVMAIVVPGCILWAPILIANSSINYYKSRSIKFACLCVRILIITLTIPCVLSFKPASALGRRCLERRIGLSTIGDDCVSLWESHKSAEHTFLTDDSLYPNSIRRLKPLHVTIYRDAPLAVHVELHGGFDHFGYNLKRDDEHNSWILEWFTEGDADSMLFRWPMR